MSANSNAAPGRLEIVRRLVNTLDIERATDALTSREEFAQWLREVNLSDSGIADAAGIAVPGALDRPTQVELDAMIRLRAALRLGLEVNHDDGVLPHAVVDVLNELGEWSRLTVRFTQEGSWTTVSAQSGVRGAVASLLGIVVAALTDGTWSRLKTCRNEACQWAFFDESRARSGKWCSMQICGNRAKQTNWRERVLTD